MILFLESSNVLFSIKRIVFKKERKNTIKIKYGMVLSENYCSNSIYFIRR